MEPTKFVISVLGLVLGMVEVDANYCPKVNRSAPLKFTREMNTEDWIKSGKKYVLQCCATGFHNITWTFYSKVRGKEIEFPSDCNYNNNTCGRLDSLLLDDGQVTQTSPAGEIDEGNYTCILDGKLKQTTSLSVIECNSLGRGPIVIKRPSDESLVVSVGDTRSFQCGGYYGCGDNSTRDIRWVRFVDDSNIEFLSNSKPRYKTTLEEREESSILTSTFTITDIQNDDIGVQFTCLLTSSSLQNSISNVSFVLRKKEVPHPRMATGAIMASTVGATIGAVLVLCAAVGIIHWQWGPQVSLFIKLKTGWCLRRRDGHFKYDLVLYHVETEGAVDERIALSIQEYLEEKGYQLFGPKNVRYGHRIMSISILDELWKGAVLGFVLSDHVTTDQMGTFLFNVAERVMGYHNIVLIDCRSKQRKAVLNCTCLREKEENHTPADGENLIRQNCDRIPESIVRIIKSLKWPGNSGDRLDDIDNRPGDIGEGIKWDRFWCKLQLLLPKKEQENTDDLVPVENGHGGRLLTREELHRMAVPEEQNGV